MTDPQSIPRPGQSVRGSRSGAPIMALFDLLGRRWAMGVLWTICEQGPLGFSRLEELCETISPAVLSQRLKDLQAAQVVERTVDGYAPTELGRRIHRELVPLGETAKVWARALER
jgi:DNA-binding HxlR family transcriptional regulator